MRNNRLVRLFLIAAIWFTVTRMGYGILSAMAVTFFIVLGFNVLMWFAKSRNRRRA